MPNEDLAYYFRAVVLHTPDSVADSNLGVISDSRLTVQGGRLYLARNARLVNHNPRVLARDIPARGSRLGHLRALGPIHLSDLHINRSIYLCQIGHSRRRGLKAQSIACGPCRALPRTGD